MNWDNKQVRRGGGNGNGEWYGGMVDAACIARGNRQQVNRPSPSSDWAANDPASHLLPLPPTFPLFDSSRCYLVIYNFTLAVCGSSGVGSSAHFIAPIAHLLQEIPILHLLITAQRHLLSPEISPAFRTLSAPTLRLFNCFFLFRSCISSAAYIN